MSDGCVWGLKNSEHLPFMEPYCILKKHKILVQEFIWDEEGGAQKISKRGIVIVFCESNI